MPSGLNSASFQEVDSLIYILGGSLQIDIYVYNTVKDDLYLSSATFNVDVCGTACAYRSSEYNIYCLGGYSHPTSIDNTVWKSKILQKQLLHVTV